MTAKKAAAPGSVGPKSLGPKPPAKKSVAGAKAKTPPVKKSVSKPVTAKPTPAKKRRKVDAIQGEAYYQLVQHEAYLLAEKDGFRDDPANYWLAAEEKLASK